MSIEAISENETIVIRLAPARPLAETYTCYAQLPRHKLIGCARANVRGAMPIQAHPDFVAVGPAAVPRRYK